MEGGLAHHAYRPEWAARQTWAQRTPLWLGGGGASDGDGDREGSDREAHVRGMVTLLRQAAPAAPRRAAAARARARSSSADQHEVGAARRWTRRPSLSQALDSLRLSLRASSEQQLAGEARPRRVVLRRLSGDEAAAGAEPPPPGPLSVHISQDDQQRVFAKFFAFKRCYDVMPNSGKLVVFDVDLPAGKAYHMLAHNGVRAAPLWDGRRQQFVGMVTMTDLLEMLVESGAVEAAAPRRLSEWRMARRPRPLVHLRPDASLLEAAGALLRERLHRLPVLDPASGDLLHLVTRQRLLRFLRLHQHELPRPAMLDAPLRALPLGTFTRLELARPETSVAAAAGALLRRRVSALPVVDAAGRLVRVCTKAELLEQAVARSFGRLQEPISAGGPPGAVATCRLDDTLGQLLERAGRAQVHRLIAVDHQGRVVGVVSLSDLLRLLLDEPSAPAADV